jgi:hypothetical protein
LAIGANGGEDIDVGTGHDEAGDADNFVALESNGTHAVGDFTSEAGT